MDMSSVENVFRRTLLTGAVMAAIVAGMWCFKIVKVPKHPASAQTTPVPSPAFLDAPVSDSSQQVQSGDLPLTTFVTPGKSAQP